MDSSKSKNTPTRQIGDVSVVLLQHWATMIDGLREASARSANAAAIAQHQVHVLQRERLNLEGQLFELRMRSDQQERHLHALATFTTHSLMWHQDMDENHFLAREYNRLINEINAEYPIDLTASDTETEEDD